MVARVWMKSFGLMGLAAVTSAPIFIPSCMGKCKYLHASHALEVDVGQRSRAEGARNGVCLDIVRAK